MADWQSDSHLRSHFRRHARRLGCATVEEYDASTRETIEEGIHFEYRDPDTGEWRMGAYDRVRQRFTAMTDDQTVILSHFRCPERYVAETLPESTDV